MCTFFLYTLYKIPSFLYMFSFLVLSCALHLWLLPKNQDAKSKMKIFAEERNLIVTAMPLGHTSCYVKRILAFSNSNNTVEGSNLCQDPNEKATYY